MTDEAPTMTVADVPDSATFVTDREVRTVLDHIGYDDGGTFNTLFVETADGEYSAVYACRKSVPWLHSTVYKLR